MREDFEHLRQFRAPREIRDAWEPDFFEGGDGGIFYVGSGRQEMKIIASRGGGWEHVSVSLKKRPPSWAEMCRVKDFFWEPGECVVQYHPPEDAYVNFHPRCLHLWKPIGVELPAPPTWMIGPKP